MSLRKGMFRLWVLTTAVWLGLVGVRVAYEFEGHGDPLLVEEQLRPPRLREGDIENEIANLRKGTAGPESAAPSSTSQRSAGLYDVFLDTQLQQRTNELKKLVANIEIPPPEVGKITGLSSDVIAKSPEKAEYLAKLLDFKQSLDASPILRFQVYGPEVESRRINLLRLIGVLLVAPLALFLAGRAMLWAIEGFGCEA